MNIKQIIRKATIATTWFLMLVLCGINISCEKDDKGSSTNNGLVGWYTDLSSVAKQSDFNKLNEAIRNNELLSSYKYGGATHYYYATRDLFFNDGMYNDSDGYFGRLRFSINNVINAIRIVNDNTLFFYSAFLYEDGEKTEDAVYKLYAGPIFGDLTYYDSPSCYTYVRIDNKLIVSNGDIYTIIEGKLIKDGSSTRWSKYDPSKKY